MDSQPPTIPDPTPLPRKFNETARAHEVIRTHLPQRDRRWLGMRLVCRQCGQRYPCPPKRNALNHLERGVAPPVARVAPNQANRQHTGRDPGGRIGPPANARATPPDPTTPPPRREHDRRDGAA